MNAPIVELRYASLPGWLGFVAVHFWFVVHDGTEQYRYEVWQRPNVGKDCVGHLHRNLMKPESNIGGGPTQIANIWKEEEAKQICEILQNSHTYPFCHSYFPWPGPNSNTFVAWVLREANISYDLHWMALGKHFPVP